jgi:hypothetical protein
MADFSLTTMFVVPSSETALPSSGSTQDLAAGQLGLFLNTYATAAVGTIAAAPYFYVAQGRENTYLLGSKKSDKIKGCPSGTGCNSNVTDWRKTIGCPTPINQIIDINDWHVKCGEIVTLTLRGFSSYLQTLYFNGWTKSVTVNAPCCDCGGNPCTDTDVSALIDALIVKLNADASDFLGGSTSGTNPDNIRLNQFYTFTNVGGTTLRIEGKALTQYGQPCDVAAFPFEYDRLWFRAFVYSGPATTVDFIVSDACNIVADATTVQESNYATGLAKEIAQLEKNYYSYQVGAMKHLYRIAGYNPFFESYVETGKVYDLFYIRFNQFNKDAQNWGDYIPIDETVIIAVPQVSGAAFLTELEGVLEAALGAVASDQICLSTTTTSTTTATI